MHFYPNEHALTIANGKSQFLKTIMRSVKKIDNWPKVEQYVSSKISRISDQASSLLFGAESSFGGRQFQFASIGASHLMNDDQETGDHSFIDSFKLSGDSH